MTPSIDQHFAGKNALVRATYDRLKQAAARFGHFSEDAKKTSIHLNRRTAFAGVATRKNAIRLTIKADDDIRSKRVVKRDQASANRWHLEVILASPKDVDAELLGWLKRAYKLVDLVRSYAVRTTGNVHRVGYRRSRLIAACSADSKWPAAPQPVELMSLLVLDKAEATVRSTRSRVISCQLKNDKFEITIEPSVSNVNLVGRCGDAVSGMVTIVRNGTAIVKQQEFEAVNCHEQEKMLQQITLTDGSVTPQVIWVEY